MKDDRLSNKNELERTRLEEGIKKPLCHNSKGYLLLEKMGYKHGMSIGIKREGSEGIKEPISFEIRSSSGRSGVGLFKQKEQANEELKRSQVRFNYRLIFPTALIVC